jgi:hydroxyacylglutathione hydrolase
MAGMPWSIPELGLQFDIFDLSGHTSQHIGYYLGQEQPMLFCGDALFSLGCGRVFDGTYAQLTDSLERLAHLPDNTRVYCAHEYTKQNAAFARKVLPNNSALHTYQKKIHISREPGLTTIPTTIGFEKMCNPFLRLQDPDLHQSLGVSHLDSKLEILTKLRVAKDHFT